LISSEFKAFNFSALFMVTSRMWPACVTIILSMISNCGFMQM
jgi:hypothetical protein